MLNFIEGEERFVLEPPIKLHRLIWLYIKGPAQNWTERFVAEFIGESDKFIDSYWMETFCRNLQLFAPDIVAVRLPLLELLYNSAQPPALAANQLLAEQNIYQRHILRCDPQTGEFFALYWPDGDTAPHLEEIFHYTPAERVETIDQEIAYDGAIIAVLRSQIDMEPDAPKAIRLAREARLKEVADNDLRLRLIDWSSLKSITVPLKRKLHSQNTQNWPSLSFEESVN